MSFRYKLQTDAYTAACAAAAADDGLTELGS